MLKTIKLLLIWILASFTTVGIAYYQRVTGPTYPQKIEYKDQEIKLLRSGTTSLETEIIVQEDSSFNAGRIVWKFYPGDHIYDTIPFVNNGSFWKAHLPSQPPAGKLEYYIQLEKNENIVFSNLSSPVVIRYKGMVSPWALIPHIFFMFMASFLSIAALFMIVLKTGNYKLLSLLIVVSLAIGGLIFGPIVQNFAFGHYWTGFPFGYDLTDNKTLIAFIIWLIAVISNRKSNKKSIIIFATLSMLVINSIPHSTMGSELNRESGQVETAE